MTQGDLRLRKLKSRLNAEALQVAGKYGATSYDDEGATWLHVQDFKLPEGWNRSKVGILIDIPVVGLGYPHVAPQWFWTSRDLKTRDGAGIGHFFSAGSNSNSEYERQGWAHFCIHVNIWKPAGGSDLRQGHSLLTYLDLINTVFHDHKTLRLG